MGFNDSMQHSPKTYKSGEYSGSIKLEGVEQLLRNLKKHLTGFTDQEVRNMLKGGAQIIVDSAKAKVRVNDGGVLRNSIKVLPKWRKDPQGIYVGPRVLRRFTKRTSQKAKDNNPFYAHFEEYGTDPHDNSFQGKFVSSPKARRHPGTHARPYMRPAYDETKFAAINKMYDDIIAVLERRH